MDIIQTRCLVTECNLCKYNIFPEFPKEYHVEICICGKIVHRRCLDNHITNYRQDRINVEIYKQRLECEDCVDSYCTMNYYIHNSLTNDKCDEYFPYVVLSFLYLSNLFFGQIIVKTCILLMEYVIFIAGRHLANKIVYEFLSVLFSITILF